MEPLLFCCAAHVHAYQCSSPHSLIESAARSIIKNTHFGEDGLPVLACRDLTLWRGLCNTFQALAYQGYHQGHDALLTMLVSSIESLDGGLPQPGTGLFKKGKPFERLVTRLYLEELRPSVDKRAAPTNGESVRVLWNKKLISLAGGRRQIDVLIERRREDFVSHTIVECRDHEVEVSEMDAFATLIRRVEAERGVMVSSVGFQSGALRSAAIDGIETRVVTEEDFAEESVETTVDPFYEFQVIAYTFGSAELNVPPVLVDQPHELQVVESGESVGTLSELFARKIEREGPAPRSLPPTLRIVTPDTHIRLRDGRVLAVDYFDLTLRVIETTRRRTLALPRRPLAFLVQGSAQPVRTVAADNVPLFPSPTFKPQRFYVNLLGQLYFCESASAHSDEARIILLNDVQTLDGKPIDIEGTVTFDQAGHFFPMEDRDALEAHKAMWTRFKRMRARQVSR